MWIENKWDWDKKYAIIHLKFSKSDYQELGLRDALISELDKSAAILNLQLSKPTLKERFEELIVKASAQGKVVLLIDEYDKPIIDYIEQPDKANENREILKQFYSIVKDSEPYIRFLLITGVSKFSKAPIFSDLNNLEDITVSESMNDLVGITQQELETYFIDDIKKLTNKFETTETELLKQVMEWYNGYNWGGDNTLYNPFSLISFFQREQFSNFWFEAGTPTFLIKQVKCQNDINFENLNTTQSQFSCFNLGDFSPMALLFQTGYLTIKKYDHKRLLYTLCYPNKEVKHSLPQLFKEA